MSPLEMNTQLTNLRMKKCPSMIKLKFVYTGSNDNGVGDPDYLIRINKPDPDLDKFFLRIRL